MKQVLRKGLKDIVVEEVPDPLLQAHHVLIRPAYSLISSGTETASLHQEGVVAELRHNPSHLQKIAAAVRSTGPVRTFSEVKAKFSEYAVLGYSGAGKVAQVHPSVTDIEVGQPVAFGGEGSGHSETVLAGRNLVVPVPDGVSLEEWRNGGDPRMPLSAAPKHPLLERTIELVELPPPAKGSGSGKKPR